MFDVHIQVLLTASSERSSCTQVSRAKHVVGSIVKFLIVGSLHAACPPGCSMQ